MLDNQHNVRWTMINQLGKKIVSDIDCYGLMMNHNEDLFVSDCEKGGGTIVAGGNGQGNQFNQLKCPTFIFIDREETVYVSDRDNHRVMKWMKGAKEGVVVAGGQGNGSSLKQLSFPQGIVVNEIGDVFVADRENHRIMCWLLGSQEGHVVIDGNHWMPWLNQLNYPQDLSFDAENNLYVADWGNNRIQQFDIDTQ